MGLNSNSKPDIHECQIMDLKFGQPFVICIAWASSSIWIRGLLPHLRPSSSGVLFHLLMDVTNRELLSVAKTLAPIKFFLGHCKSPWYAVLFICKANSVSCFAIRKVISDYNCLILRSMSFSSRRLVKICLPSLKIELQNVHKRLFLQS